jgi:CRISPR-associated protein Csm1
MEHNREHLYLAALLHDIGKFYQRADAGSASGSKELSLVTKNNQANVLPVRDGNYTHKHCLWTAQFIESNNAVFKKLIGADSSWLSDKDNLYNLAACHHLGKEQLSPLGQIIKEADCLSSGMDRDSDEALLDDQDTDGWDAFKKKSMTSILQTIGMEEAELYAKTNWWHLPVATMSLSKAVFPAEHTDTPDYASLWKSFRADFKFIQSTDYTAFSETFLQLLLKYASCIPASTINFPDVSLYDHAKTTAALAVCLYDFQESREESRQPFLLIGADFSGIQGYIYQIVSEYAGRNLKGRSFFLRILSDAVVRLLLDKLRLFRANVIYDSGGSFYLLAPNTAFVRAELQKATSLIETNFFNEFGTTLFVAIDSIPLAKEDLLHTDEEHNLGIRWHELFERRDKKKANKFASLVKDGYARFFEPILQGGDARRDRITGEEFLPGEKVYPDGELILKKNTHLQLKLGQKLKRSSLMLVSREELPYWKDITHLVPADLGYHYYFVSKDELEKLSDSMKASSDGCTVILFNDMNFVQALNGKNNSYEFIFYGGNQTNEKTFDQMAGYKRDDTGFSRLGVLRMDVDNLGHIFQGGILPRRATLSRYAALSRSLDYFFSGYINTIWEEIDPKHSLIVYSGGDDLFIVGSWDATIRLAERIREDFRTFTCHNPAFSISGGIAILPPRYPIMKGADESADEERAAKEHTVKKASKNSLSFMDTPLNWDTEFPTVKRLKDRLVEQTRNDRLPKSFISKLLAHAESGDIRDHQIKNIKTYWMLTYDLSRMKERKASTANQLIDICIKEVCGNGATLGGESISTDYHPLELWAFAARWAELEIRTNNNSKIQ